jgi:thioredoxin reductase
MISSPEFANRILEKGQCDLVFLGRTLLADPQWPKKVRQGEMESVRPCIRCNQCIGSHFQGMPVSCTVNPHAGRERQFRWRTKAVSKYRSAVIGSGPAGLQAAVSLSRLGLEVTLFEKEDRGGGLMNLAGIPPHKQRILDLRDYLLGQLRQSKVEQLFSYEFKAEDLERFKPDLVLLATGSIPVIPNIEGIEENDYLGLEEILTRKFCPQSQHLLVIGGGENGCEVADFLAQAGNKVTIIEAGRLLAPGMEKKNRRDLMNRLHNRGVAKRLSSQVTKIDKNRVWIAREQEEPEIVEADAIVMAVGYKSYRPLYKDLRQLGDKLYVIGDALRVRGFKSAILEAELTVGMIARDKFGISSFNKLFFYNLDFLPIQLPGLFINHRAGNSRWGYRLHPGYTTVSLPAGMKQLNKSSSSVLMNSLGQRSQPLYTAWTIYYQLPSSLQAGRAIYTGCFHND